MSTTTENIELRTSRFRDASWFKNVHDLHPPIVIGGAGGIGSWVGLLLSRVLKQNHIIVIYDFDRIEEVNLAGQFFRRQRIGEFKAGEVRQLMIQFSGSRDVHSITGPFDNTSFLSTIMFSCFDNMEARKIMFKVWKKYSDENPKEKAILIDGRLLAEQFQILFVTRERADEYENKYLFEDSEVEDANCSYKQTSHFAANVAAKMVQGFTNWLAEDNTTVVPFYYEEIGGLFYSQSDE
jgi:molybdopterin/thiamine biosynthesis adenylyltransferase